MELPENTFKQSLRAGRQQIGLWCTLSHPYGLEVLAGAGFDWLMIDTEHSPSDLEGVLAQLQTVAAYPVSAVVRPAWNDPVLIKRYLDIGAQTLLVPYVQNADEAVRAVRSVEYPARGMANGGGIRGVSALTRATRFGRIKNYAATCRDELCLLVQVETPEALARVEEITQVPGVDGVFVGPGDLAANMGLQGELGHPDVVAAIEDAIARIRRCGKPAGILTGDRAFAQRCIELGTLFTAVGVDVGILATGSSQLRSAFAASRA